jgi:hypothetical protein
MDEYVPTGEASSYQAEALSGQEMSGQMHLADKYHESMGPSALGILTLTNHMRSRSIASRQRLAGK